MSIGLDSARAPSWLTAVASARAVTDYYSFPFLGHPEEHLCDDLRSATLTASVVLPTWNALPSLRACLASLERSSLNRLAPERLQVIVCDDGSDDGTWDDLCRGRYALNLVSLRLEHRGQSAAMNAGLRAADGDVVVACDSDMILGCGALDELLARHELWPTVACFGFRSDIEASRLPLIGEALADLMHTEALTGDNRVTYDHRTLITNMLADCGWLAHLDDGRYLLDCEGIEWRRHRFMFGCLFSAPRSLFDAVGGMPDGIRRWGYNDTLIAAAFEAHGFPLLPVFSASGHHVSHPIRRSDQWFQYYRNRLAYEFILDAEEPQRWWHAKDGQSRVLETHSSQGAPMPPWKPQPVRPRDSVDYFLGRWDRFLDQCPDAHPLRRAECLFRTGRHDELIANESDSYWRSAALASAGRPGQARACLERAAWHDPVAEYVHSASASELLQLARHHRGQGLGHLAALYDLAAEVAG